MFVHTLAEGYRWSYEECVKRTYPQIIMLGHAAHVSKLRMDKRLGQKKKAEKPVEETVFNGKKLSELSTAEYVAYYGSSEAKDT